jgi:SAM-dependent methyltransferase
MPNSRKKRRPLISFPGHSRINWALQNPTAFFRKYFFNIDKYYFSRVYQDIAPEDDMYAGDRKHYFGVGESALKNILTTLKLVNKGKPLSILDIPCGYGRVMRYLKTEFPKASITACDLDRKMVDFCVKTFNAKGIYSDKNIRNVKVDGKFDLIWCGSLFTHLDKEYWPDFFEFFYDHLAEKGMLIFTTHGRCVANWMINKIYDYGVLPEKVPEILDSYKKSGFGYANYPNNNEYGISMSTPSWIFKKLEKYEDLRVVLFSEQSWDNHQDVMACMKNGKMEGVL